MHAELLKGTSCIVNLSGNYSCEANGNNIIKKIMPLF